MTEDHINRLDKLLALLEKNVTVVDDLDDLPTETIVLCIRSTGEDGKRIDPSVSSIEVECCQCKELVWLSPNSPQNFPRYCSQCLIVKIKEEADNDMG